MVHLKRSEDSSVKSLGVGALGTYTNGVEFVVIVDCFAVFAAVGVNCGDVVVAVVALVLVGGVVVVVEVVVVVVVNVVVVVVAVVIGFVGLSQVDVFVVVVVIVIDVSVVVVVA